MKRTAMKTQEPRSSSSCAACKFLKRKCIPNCQFAPYFRSDEPKRFAKVHKVFGASNVSKILNEVPEEQREETVNSLVYEAEVRLRDPVYGCIGAIASLQKKMVELQHDLIVARARLAYCATATTNGTNAAACPTLLVDDHANNLPPNYIEIPVSTGLMEQTSFDLSSFFTASENINGWMNEFGQLPLL